MANNIPVTPGSGATVATDQLSTGEHVQLMKLMGGTEDSTERIGGDATNGIDVDVTRVQGTVTVDSELTTVDMDTGGGTVLRAAVGIFVPAAGGPVLVPGDGTLGIKAQMTQMPAAGRDTDTITVYHATDAIMNGTTPLVPKFANITASSGGSTTVVAAVTGKKIRVVCFNLTAQSTVSVKFQSGTGGTDITGLYYLTAGNPLPAAYIPAGHFETASSTLLCINLSGSTPVGGSLTYIEV